MRGNKICDFSPFFKNKKKCENSKNIKLTLDEVEYFFQKTSSTAAEISFSQYSHL